MYRGYIYRQHDRIGNTRGLIGAWAMPEAEHQNMHTPVYFANLIERSITYNNSIHTDNLKLLCYDLKGRYLRLSGISWQRPWRPGILDAAWAVIRGPAGHKQRLQCISMFQCLNPIPQIIHNSQFLHRVLLRSVLRLPSSAA